MNRPTAEAARNLTAGPSPANEPRAVLIAKALRSVARRSRTPRGILVSSGAPPDDHWQRIFVWAIAASFAIIVALPNMVAGAYLAFVASDQYATETRFALRGGESSVMDQLSGLIGFSAANRVQDSLIVTDYVRSRTLIEAVDRKLNLRAMFSRDGVDFLSRFNPARPDEDLMRYWRRHVEASIDTYSGIITVVVRAFTPQDSLALANEIAAQSEAMINDLTGRSRNDALQQAWAELGRARQNLEARTLAMRDLRNAEGVLDTGKTGEMMTKMLGEMRLEQIRMEQEYGAQRQTVSAEAPQLKVLFARIESMREQIRRLESEMTGSGGKAAPLSKSISRFDMAQIEKTVAERQYIAAGAAYERARMDLENQTTYLASFLKPSLAQEALYPKRLWLAAIVLLLTLSLWGAGVGTAVAVRNHVAV